MVASIKARFDIDAELVPGTRGVYDIEVDGTKVFSKYDVRRFPMDDDEVLDAIAALQS